MTKNDNLPSPAGWRVLVEIQDPDNKTKGGIYLPDTTVDAQRYGAAVAKVIELGPLAYGDEAKFGPAGGAWCKAGDFVVLAKYSGWRFEAGGKHYKLVNDDEILGVVVNPDAIKV